MTPCRCWQGGEDRVVDRLTDLGGGVYRSTEPIPLHGNWKSGLRLQSGRERGAVPLRLPVDEGIAPDAEPLATSYTDAEAAEEAIRGGNAGGELAAPASFTRVFTDDSLIVLREQKGDVGAWIWGIAIAIIGAFYVLFVAGLALGVARSARGAPLAGARLPELGPAPAHRLAGGEPGITTT